MWQIKFYFGFTTFYDILRQNYQTIWLHASLVVKWAKGTKKRFYFVMFEKPKVAGKLFFRLVSIFPWERERERTSERVSENENQRGESNRPWHSAGFPLTAKSIFVLLHFLSGRTCLRFSFFFILRRPDNEGKNKNDRCKSSVIFGYYMRIWRNFLHLHSHTQKMPNCLEITSHYVSW